MQIFSKTIESSRHQELMISSPHEKYLLHNQLFLFCGLMVCFTHWIRRTATVWSGHQCPDIRQASIDLLKTMVHSVQIMNTIRKVRVQEEGCSVTCCCHSSDDYVFLLRSIQETITSNSKLISQVSFPYSNTVSQPCHNNLH